MMNNIPMPKISQAFAIEDIHKIREWQYEKRRNMTSREICEDTHKGAERFLALLGSPVSPNIEAEINRRLQSVRSESYTSV